MVFDAECNSVLHTEMAKKNLFVKRGRYLFTMFLPVDDLLTIIVAGLYCACSMFNIWYC